MRKLLLSACLFAMLTNFVLAQCNGIFYDGFESGSYTPTWSIGTGLTSGAVTTTNPYSGLYRLEGTGGTMTHLTGFSTTIAASTPSTVSWDIFPTGTGAANYMVLGNSSVSATNCIAFAYWQGGTNIRFVSGSTAIYTCSPGAWYHIEMRNINFTTHMFDIYINNTLVQANFPFRNSSQNDLTQIHLYNFNSATGVWDNITIGTGNSPVNTFVVTPPLCNGGNNGAIDLSVTGGSPAYSYLWSNGDTTQDLGALTAGTYDVTVSDQTPCSTTTSIVVTEPTAIVVAPSATDLSCFNSGDGTASTNVSGGTPGYFYQWSNSGTSPGITGLAAGTYFVTVTDGNGCVKVDSATAAEPSQILIADSLILPLCHGDSNGVANVSATGGAGTYSYLWSTGDTLPGTGFIPAGVYTVMVTDSNGCSQSDSILMPEPPVLTISSIATDPLCIGDSSGTIDLTPGGGTPNYSFVWNTGDSLEDLLGLPASVYIVLVTDANGCSVADTAILNNPTAISATGTVTDDLGSNNGAIDLSVSGGTPGYSFLWSNGATTEDVTGLAAGIYNVTITDNNGCTFVQSFTVNLVIAIGNSTPLNVSVYPNPFQSGFTVQFSTLDPETNSLSITDMQGRIVWTMPMVNTEKNVVDVDLPAGFYLLNVQQGDRSTTIKLSRQ